MAQHMATAREDLSTHLCLEIAVVWSAIKCNPTEFIK